MVWWISWNVGDLYHDCTYKMQVNEHWVIMVGIIYIFALSNILSTVFEICCDVL